MGYDDGMCDQSPDGAHRFVLQDLVPGKTAGMAMVSECANCGTTLYEASAGDDPRRRPLL